MSRLFQRSCALTLARPSGYFTQANNATVISALRVQFEVKKSRRKEPNTCSITVSNLNADSRAALAIKPLHVRLDAGYDDNLGRLFTGDMRWSESVKFETDWETKIEVGDGERAYRHARVNRSYEGGVTARVLLAECASALALPLPPTAHLTELDTQYVSGFSLHGPAQRELTRILDPLDIRWSIQDGRLQLERERDARGEPAIVVSPDTGLIGGPSFGSPAEKGKPAVLSFRMLLFPALTPGGLVRVESRNISGTFKLDRVLHVGDTHGAAWYSECEARTYR